MKKIVSLFIVLLMICSCGTMRKVQYVPVETRIEVRDTVIRDTVVLTIEKEVIREVCPEVDTLYMENSYSVSKTVLDTNMRVLRGELITKPQKIEKEVEVRTQIKEVIKEVPLEVKIPEPYVPDYYKRINIIFWVMISVFVIFIAVKVYLKLKP